MRAREACARSGRPWPASTGRLRSTGSPPRSRRRAGWPMPTVVPASQIFQVVEDGADSTPVSTAAASFTVHRQSAVAPQPYRGFVARPATAPAQQPQARPPKRPSTPKVRSLLASTAPKPKYHGLRSDGVRELLEGRKPHPADPKSIDHRPPRPSAS